MFGCTGTNDDQESVCDMTQNEQFVQRLMRAANALAEMAARQPDAELKILDARLALARFLVGSELAFEAIGVLNDALRALAEVPVLAGPLLVAP